MNRLILIGNGFDLAHGLKTDYNSFIVWYLSNCFERATKNREYHDPLIDITTKFDITILPREYRESNELINALYKNNFSELLTEKIKLPNHDRLFMNPFGVKFKPVLGKVLLENCHSRNWVDIENTFYKELKRCLNYATINVDMVNSINNDLKFIVQQLERYLQTQTPQKFSPGYSKILSSYIKKEDIVLTSQDLHLSRLYQDEAPRTTMLLNFNYTSTIDNYLKRRADLPLMIHSNSFQTNYIHGQIGAENNPIIFGFGDELDDDYKKMEHSGINEFFEYIKSFWYFKTSNYHNLIRFIESDMYQVYILGHSCGLSDRTLLNMIFENENCKSIKIFYYDDEEKNNYIRLTQEISRHFKDKVALRRKIVNFERSEPMPQIE